MPVGVAIVIGSLTFVFAQTKTEPSNGRFPNGDQREFARIPPPPPFGPAPGAIDPRMFAELDLTDAQQTAIRALMDNARTASGVYFEKLRVVEAQLGDTTGSEAFDEAAARQLLKTRGEIQTEIEIIRLKTDSAIRNLLTAEQLARLDLLKSRRPDFPPAGPRPPMPPPPQ